MNWTSSPTFLSYISFSHIFQFDFFKTRRWHLVRALVVPILFLPCSNAKAPNDPPGSILPMSMKSSSRIEIGSYSWPSWHILYGSFWSKFSFSTGLSIFSDSYSNCVKNGLSSGSSNLTGLSSKTSFFINLTRLLICDDFLSMLCMNPECFGWAWFYVILYRIRLFRYRLCYFLLNFSYSSVDNSTCSSWLLSGSLVGEIFFWVGAGSSTWQTFLPWSKSNFEFSGSGIDNWIRPLMTI